MSAPQPTQAEILEAIESVTRMTDALQLDAETDTIAAVNEDHDAIRKVLDWARDEVAAEPAPAIQVERSLRLGDRVRVVGEPANMRSMIAHHLGRRGKVVAFDLDVAECVGVYLDQIGVVSFMGHELELER